MQLKTSVRGLYIIAFFSFLTLSSYAQKGNQKDCGTSCFKTHLQKVTPVGAECTKYTLLVTSSGGCLNALSHYAVGVPSCGSITEVSNSEGWKQEVGITDPGTGLTGFKIDEITGFGEDGKTGEFTVEFTVCGTKENCAATENCWSPEVAYKAGQCVYYEQTDASCNKLAGNIETTDVTCFAASDGRAAVNIEAGEAPFSYKWSNNRTTAVISGIPAGSYHVDITDATGETLKLTATINQPEQISATLDIVQATCGGVSDGSAEVVVSGGVPPYTYAWSTGSTTSQLQGIAAGYYEVTITDSQSCTLNMPVVVQNKVNISLTGSSQATACNTNTGSIDLSVSGGTEPYSYSWSTGETSEDLAALGAGIYSVEVVDANGCKANKSFMVREDNPLNLKAVTVKTACAEDNSGSIDLTATGGAEPYRYLWSNGETTEDISGLAQGIYDVEVTDQNSCTASMRVSVTAESFQVSSSTKNPSCHGETDGSIAVTPTGGESPYSYEWSTGSTADNIQNLSGGLYDVLITDAKGCSRKLNFYLTDPSEITISSQVANESCVEGAFYIDLTVSGGTHPYTYIWSDGTTTADIDSLSTGTYTVHVTDAKGCTISKSIAVDKTTAGCSEISNPDDNTEAEVPDEQTDNETGDDTVNEPAPDGSDEAPVDDGNTEDPAGDGERPADETDSGGTDDGDSTDPDDGLADNCNNPFETQIELIAVEGNCYTYTAEVKYNGYHEKGLSHFTLAVPCGTIEDIRNSENWKIEVGTDPTTNLEGLKIDDISNFGEGAWPEEFLVNFTICATDNACSDVLSDGSYTVAYKYGQCLSYESVPAEKSGTASHKVYPNPFSDKTTIEFSDLPVGYTTVEIYNGYGRKVKELFSGFTEKGVVYTFPWYGDDLPNDTYTYRITTPLSVLTGKVMLIKR